MIFATKNLKVRAIAISTLVACITFISCSDDKNAKINPHKKISKDGVMHLNVATSPDFKPFEYIASNGKLSGFDIQLLEKIDENLPDVSLSIHETSFDKVLSGVENGKYELAMSAISITKDRSSKITFSKPYYVPSFSALVVEEYKAIPVTTEDKSMIQRDEIFKEGIRIGVLKGTPTEEATINEVMNCKNKGVHVEVKSLDTYKALLKELHDKNIDAVLIESVEVDNPEISQHSQLVSAYEVQISAPYGYGIAFNAKNTEGLVKKFNEQIDILTKSGYISSLAEKWNLPMIGKNNSEKDNGTKKKDDNDEAKEGKNSDSNNVDNEKKDTEIVANNSKETNEESAETSAEAKKDESAETSAEAKKGEPNTATVEENKN